MSHKKKTFSGTVFHNETFHWLFQSIRTQVVVSGAYDKTDHTTWSEKGMENLVFSGLLVSFCYRSHGHFERCELLWEQAWYRVLNMFPRPPEEIRPDFLYYSRANSRHPVKLLEGIHHTVNQSSNFDPKKWVKTYGIQCKRIDHTLYQLVNSY